MPGGQPRFVERSDALTRISDRLTGSSGPTGIVLGGPAGIGKSHLASEVVRALPPEVHTEWFNATQALQPVPFGVFSALLPPSERTSPALDAPDVLSTLNRLRAVLSDRAGPGDLVLVVDDAQHLDDASSLLVHQMTLLGEIRPLIVIQSGSPSPGPIVSLWKDALCERLDLGPLTREGIGELAGLIAGAPFDQQSVDRLHELSNGNPLLLEQLLGDAKAPQRTGLRGLLSWSGPADGADVACMVEKAFARLDSDAGRLVQLLALGEPLPASIITKTSSWETLADLEHDGYVAVGPPPEHLVRLDQPLWSEVVRSAMPDATRALLLSELADTFEAAGFTGPDDHLRTQLWRVAAGSRPEPAPLVAAARTALSRGDVVLAERLARLARDGDRTPETDLVLALILETGGAEQEAVELLEDLAPKLSGGTDRATALCALMRLLAGRIGSAAVLDGIAEVAATIEDQTSRDAVEAQRATTLALIGDIAAAMKIACPLQENPDELVLLRSFPAIELGMAASGQIERALELTTTLLPVAMGARDVLPSGISWTISASLRHLDALGRLDDVEQLLDMLAAQPSARLPAARAFRLLHAGRLAIARGQVDTAGRLLDEAVALYEERNCPVFLPIALAWASEAAALHGDAALAVQIDTALGDRAARDVGRPLHYDAQRARSWSLATSGETGQAIQRLELVAARATEAGSLATASAALHDAVRLGAGTSAQSQLVDLASRIDGELAAARVEHARAALAHDGAGIEQSARSFNRLGYHLVASDLHTLAAHTHAEQGDHVAARRCTAQARQLLLACEGARSIAPAAGYGVPELTPTELSIASLAASGSTSREIARQRVVSVRTVENHLGRAYKKLGVSSREDLAVVLAILEPTTPQPASGASPSAAPSS